MMCSCTADGSSCCVSSSGKRLFHQVHLLQDRHFCLPLQNQNFILQRDFLELDLMVLYVQSTFGKAAFEAWF